MNTPTHADMVALIRGKTGRDRRKIGNNLWADIADDGSVVITLHATAIVQLFADGSAIVNSGGWRTHTTKKRINQFSPVRVYQRKYDWFFENGTPFEDNTIITKDWIVPVL